MVAEQWRRICNQVRVHGSLGWRPLAPEVALADDLPPVLRFSSVRWNSLRVRTSV